VLAASLNKHSTNMKHGFLYIIFKFVLDNLKHLTMVEWIKSIGYAINKEKNNKEKRSQYGRIAVDVYIVLKWLLVFLLWSFAINNTFWTAIVWYLLITNIYSYFYYHIWCDEALISDTFTRDRTRRRFVNLLLAVTYSDFCFAYLYNLPYSKELEWSNKIITDSKSMWFSVSNSLAANYEAVKPISDLGNSVAMIQLVLTFIFVTILISKSIPQTSSQI
jgi:hypothetical protein